MKMDSMNISLPQDMAQFVRRQVNQNYGNVSEFFRELIREKIKREVAADLAFLKSTERAAPAGPTEKEVEEILAIQRRVRRRPRSCRRARRPGGLYRHL